MATIARVMYDVVARNGASGTFRRIGDDATFAEGRIARFGRAFALAGGAAAAAAVAVGAESVRMATQFQSSMTRIQTQAGGSARDVRQLTGAVLGLAQRRAQQAPQELADSLFHLKSVGMGNVQAMRALRVSSDLAAVGGAHLEETTNALAGAWRSGIKGAHNFRDAAATVNAIIGAGNMRMDDFVAAIGTGILPAARTFGVSLKSVGSALALMTDEGIPAEVAATRLRMTLSLIGAPTDKAAAELKTIGLSSVTLARTMRGPGGLVAAIALLKRHLDNSGLSAVEASQVISHAFGGGRSSSAIMTLLNNLGVLQRKQEQINRTIGNYGADVAAQRKTAGAEFGRLRAIIDAAGIRIGLALLPPVTSFVSFIVNRAIPAVGRFGSRVAAVFDQVIPIGAIKRDWQDVLQFLGLAKPKPVKLFTGDLLHLPKPAPLFAGDLIHPQPFHFAAAELFRPLPKSAGAGIAGQIAATLRSPSVGNALGNALGDAFGSLASHAAEFASRIVRALADLDWTSIGKTVGGQAGGFAIGFISGLGADLFSPTWWKRHWWDAIVAAVSVFGVGRFGAAIARVLEHIPVLRMFAPLFRGLQSITDPIAKIAGKVGGAVWRGILTGLRDVFPRGMRFLDREFGLFTTRIGVAALDILAKARSAGAGVITGIERGAAGLTRTIAGVISRITRPFRGALGWLFNAGKNVVSGLLRGIRSFMAGIGGWVKANIVDPLIGAVKHFFGIKSPSTVMMGIGGHLIGGLLRGLALANPLPIVQRIFGSIPAALGHMVEKGLISIASLPGRALSALAGLGSGLLSRIGGLLGHLFGGGGGVSRWAPLVLQVLKMLGQPAGALGIVLSQIATESGGATRAVNLSDINAQLGHPSVGLLQVIRGTFQAYAGPFRGLGPFMYGVSVNPLANIFAGLNYAIHRYGSRGWMSVLGHGHGYWQGGPITEPIFGIGRSGRAYTFGEGGLRERVVRGDAAPPRTGPAVEFSGPVHIHQEADADLLSQRLGWAVTAAGFGGGG